MKPLTIAAWILTAICILPQLPIYYIDYTYESVIGAYINNAYEVNTPERMIEQIELAKSSMESEGLTPDLYGALVLKKPDNRMSWQYDFLQSIIERAVSVIEWREAQSTSSQTESLGDVYEEKMDNLRFFLLEGGRADWISHSAWWVKYHPVLYIINLSFGYLITITIILWFIVLRRWQRRRKANKPK